MTYQAMKARMASTMITIAEYLIAAYPARPDDSGSGLCRGLRAGVARSPVREALSKTGGDDRAEEGGRAQGRPGIGSEELVEVVGVVRQGRRRSVLIERQA